jgi:hypothetical protein
LSTVLLTFLVGCTASHYRESADRAAYSAIQQKSPAVDNMDPRFTIEQTNSTLLDGLPISTNVQEYLGQRGERERGAHVVSLEDALALAVHCSRAYQTRKEQLYLSALSLTLIRHQFTPLFNASATVNYGGQTERAVTVGIDEITGEPKVIVSDNLVERQRLSGGASIGGSWLIRDVGRITTSLTADFLRFVTGDSRVTTSSQLTATFMRPLWRNAGFRQEQEVLVQAERQLLYDLREFTRYRKEFSVLTATAYYRVVGLRDFVRNGFLNLQSSRKNAERSRALAEEGRITQSDLGRLEQDELSAQSTWINAIRDYEQALDNFKIQLGLPSKSNIILDDRELEQLRILHPNMGVDESIDVALAARLDLLNTREQLEDAERKVKLAQNLLKPRVDVAASVAVNSDPNNNTGVPELDFDRYRWNAGLSIDPGLDRVAERNAYRRSLIDRNQAARAVTQKEDDIQLQIRDSWRTLEQANFQRFFLGDALFGHLFDGSLR